MQLLFNLFALATIATALPQYGGTPLTLPQATPKFKLANKAGQYWSRVPSGNDNNIQLTSNAANAITLGRLDYLTTATAADSSKTFFQLADLCDKSSPRYIRHAGYVLHSHNFAASSLDQDFAWEFQQQPDGGFLIYNSYGTTYGRDKGAYFIGLDGDGKTVKIVPQAQAVCWFLYAA